VVREKYRAEYFLCDNCGFLFVGNPTWLSEAYAEPINKTDTGYVLRNVYLSKKSLLLFYFLFGKSGTYLDFAGGYGMLARLMRDYGLNFLTTDIYTKNLFAQGFEYNNEPITALTCFECFEHLSDPKNEIKKMLSISPNIFFSTRLIPNGSLPNDDWEYYGLNHGQHIALYSEKTLTFIAKEYNLNFYTDKKNLHFFTTKKIPSWIFKFLLLLTTAQFDILIRKKLVSKTVSDGKIIGQ
jgi:hypothetical protein